MAYKVFISHSARPEEWAFINQVLGRVSPLGVQCYMAEHDLQAGVVLNDKLRDRIRQSDCVLALITKNSVKSDWVKWEVGAASGFGKLVIPVVELGVQVPVFLLNKEHIKFDPHNSAATAQAVSQYLVKLKLEQDKQQLVGWGLPFRQLRCCGRRHLLRFP